MRGCNASSPLFSTLGRNMSAPPVFSSRQAGVGWQWLGGGMRPPPLPWLSDVPAPPRPCHHLQPQPEARQARGQPEASTARAPLEMEASAFLLSIFSPSPSRQSPASREHLGSPCLEIPAAALPGLVPHVQKAPRVQLGCARWLAPRNCREPPPALPDHHGRAGVHGAIGVPAVPVPSGDGGVVMPAAAQRGGMRWRRRHPALPAAPALPRRAPPDNRVPLAHSGCWAPASLGPKEHVGSHVCHGPGCPLRWGGSARGGRGQCCG